MGDNREVETIPFSRNKLRLSSTMICETTFMCGRERRKRVIRGSKRIQNLKWKKEKKHGRDKRRSSEVIEDGRGIGMGTVILLRELCDR